jgi:twinkle protein
VLKVKFQNLGENGAEAYFKWEPKSGCFIPEVEINNDKDLPWE